MVDTSRLHTFTPSEAAVQVGVGAHSIRRWCEWHAAHLSASANPGAGGQRRLTLLDIEALKEVSNLRLQGLQTEQINERLAQLTFAEIEPSEQPEPDSTELAVQASPDALQASPAILMALEAMQRQIDGIQQAASESKRNHPNVIYFVCIGITIGLAFAALVIGLAGLYGSG